MSLYFKVKKTWLNTTWITKCCIYYELFLNQFYFYLNPKVLLTLYKQDPLISSHIILNLYFYLTTFQYSTNNFYKHNSVIITYHLSFLLYVQVLVGINQEEQNPNYFFIWIPYKVVKYIFLINFQVTLFLNLNLKSKHPTLKHLLIILTYYDLLI